MKIRDRYIMKRFLTGYAIALFLCRRFSAEALFTERSMPEFWAWLPVFVFPPIACIELDTMRT